MVSAIILGYRKGWTIKELLKQIDFNLLTRTALGLNRMDDTAFCEATFFNFQNRVLKEEDKERFKDMLAAYTKQTSGQYIYKLERAEIPRELEKLGEIYHKPHEALREGYKEIEIFRIFERVYQEHFTVVKNKVTVKKNEELHSGILQSPDDVDTTYRKKGKKDGWGQSVNVTETANPENELNLLTDIAVQSNNTDDSNIMNDRIEPLKEKTPDLKELHTDGGYGSEDNDRKFEELGITHIQTAVRGRKSKVDMTIEKTTEGEYDVSCPLHGRSCDPMWNPPSRSL